jgi:drug/metabolite transporter (DMT)-like permease
MTPPPVEITARSWIMVATLGLVWGATFLFIELALEGITPFWLASARIGFACALTCVVWLWRGGRFFLSEKTDWPLTLFVGALSTAVPFLLLSWGLQHVHSGFAGVSMAAIALMVLPLSHLLIPGETMTVRRTLGFVIGFAGVCVLIGGQALESSGAAMENAGRLACLAAAGCYALSSVGMRRLPPVDPVGLAAVPLLIGSAVVFPAAVIVEGVPAVPDGRTLLILAVLGLIPTAGANLLRVLVIRSAGPVFMSLTNYQVPIWSVVFGILILGEPLHISLFLALALILAGVFISQWSALTRLFRR